MRKRKLGLLLPVMVFFLMIGSSSTSPDILYWDEDYRLTWDDFEGTPRYDYEHISALTSSGIIYYKGCKDGKIIYKVQSYFEKNESWVKAEALTDHHLRHEQLHFDITELYARKLRKRLSEKNFQCGQEAEFEDFVGKFLDNWHMMQQAYDANSRHSMDREVQKNWYYKVAMELSLLDDFKTVSSE